MSDQKHAKNSKTIQKKNLREYQYLKFDSSTGSLKEVKFDPTDCKKNFYRLIEDCSLGMRAKQGFKLFDINLSQEALAKSCLRVLEESVNFPVRIFTLEQESQETYKVGTKKLTKSIWVQTKIITNTQSTSEEQERANKKFQINVHRFFVDDLLPKMQHFNKKFLSHEAMFQNCDIYDEDSIVEKFREDILMGINERFAMYLHADSLEK